MDTLYNSAKGALFKQYYAIHEGSHNDGFRTDIVGYAIAIQKFVDECNNYFERKNNIYEKEIEKESNKDIACNKGNSTNKSKIE